MTTTLIPKSWDDLTEYQRDEVIEYALNDRSIRMDLYYEEQRILDSMFESLKKKYNDLYEEFLPLGLRMVLSAEWFSI